MGLASLTAGTRSDFLGKVVDFNGPFALKDRILTQNDDSSEKSPFRRLMLFSKSLPEPTPQQQTNTLVQEQEEKCPVQEKQTNAPNGDVGVPDTAVQLKTDTEKNKASMLPRPSSIPRPSRPISDDVTEKGEDLGIEIAEKIQTVRQRLETRRQRLLDAQRQIVESQAQTQRPEKGGVQPAQGAETALAKETARLLRGETRGPGRQRLLKKRVKRQRQKQLETERRVLVGRWWRVEIEIQKIEKKIQSLVEIESQKIESRQIRQSLQKKKSQKKKSPLNPNAQEFVPHSALNPNVQEFVPHSES